MVEEHTNFLLLATRLAALACFAAGCGLALYAVVRVIRDEVREHQQRRAVGRGFPVLPPNEERRE